MERNGSRMAAVDRKGPRPRVVEIVGPRERVVEIVELSPWLEEMSCVVLRVVKTNKPVTVDISWLV